MIATDTKIGGITHALVAATQPSVSVLVMTYNEEGNIRRCLDSLVWSDDIVVLDSYSTDRTAAIAESYSCVRTYQHPFRDYGSQRNYGLHEIPYANEWLLVVD